VGKLLVIVGLLIAGVGLLVMAGLPIGRVPGDIVIRRGNFNVLFPGRDVDSREYRTDAAVRALSAVSVR